jgi:hypothetical protein
MSQSSGIWSRSIASLVRVPRLLTVLLQNATKEPVDKKRTLYLVKIATEVLIMQAIIAHLE